MMKLAEDVLNLLYPQKRICVFCERQTEEEFLCENCRQSLPKLQDKTCSNCGRLMGNGSKFNICMDCKKEENHFDNAFSTFRYSGIIKEGIKAYKFGHRKDLVRFFVKEMKESFLKKEISPDVITWVPLGKERLEKRGYNQAKLLAQFLSKELHIPTQPLLIRTNETSPQATLNREERLKNLKGSIIGKEQIKGKWVLLIDDVFTTGATANVCAKTLKQNGAVKVTVQTIATGKIERL